MFAASAFRIGFIAIVYIISCVLGLRGYGDLGNTLYVADEPDNTPKIITINTKSEYEGLNLERKKRDAPILPTPALQKNISAWVSAISLLN